jgi:cyclic beta-1,2-glucan synthetase
VIEPCIPRAWPGYEIEFAYFLSRYQISVANPHGVSHGVVSAELDGQLLTGPGAIVPLSVDGRTHRVRVILG